MALASGPGGPGLQAALQQQLRGGSRSARQLAEALKVSQPTLSRTIQTLPHAVTAFRITGLRTPQYALLRPLPLGLAARQSVYRVLRSGHIEPFADVEFLAGGATLERSPARTVLYQGLPPYMAFAAPSGFLGRQLAQEAARTQPFPANLRDWNDDHAVAWLFTQGLNLPGNLVFGEAGLQKELAFRQLAPVPAAGKLAHYVGQATALKAAAYGSSAGGEQPKFLSLVAGAGHVIVKFARLGSRMAALLPLEHLALRALAEGGLPAARTQLLAAEGWVFLEVQRFDRVGRQGRVGLLSAGAVDDEFFGQRDSWPEFAARCQQAKVLSAADARQVATLAAFSELVGNNDRHFENLSLLIGEDGRYQGLAPAYDILPMRYAPIGGGVDPALEPIAPQVGTIGAGPEVWTPAAQAAERFWLSVQQGVQQEDLAAPIPPALRKLAARNAAVVQQFVAPLVRA